MNLSICISPCPWHMFAQTQTAFVEGCLRRRGDSLHVQATTAVAVCWHPVAMMAPIKLSKQWSIEGGAMGSKPIGLDTKDVHTASGLLSFVKIEKGADWLLKVTTGNNSRGGRAAERGHFQFDRKEIRRDSRKPRVTLDP